MIPYAATLAFCFILSMACPRPGRGDAPVTIAAVFAKTGIASYTDSRTSRGVVLAVDEINETGGLLGTPVRLIAIDNRSTAIGAREAAGIAIDKNVTAVIGATWSAHSLAMAPLLQSAGIPMITPTSSHPDVTLTGDFIFRVCFVDAFQGRVMAHFAHDDLGAETAAVLKNVSSHYSISLGDYFAKTFEALGGALLLTEKYKEKDLDFSRSLARVKAAAPDTVFVPGYTRDSALILKQAAAMNIRTRFLGGDGWTNQMYEFGGDAIEGAYYCGNWASEVPNSKTRTLIERYRRVYGGDERIIAGLTYDAVHVLADAVRRAGAADREKIRDALARTENFQGAAGAITFDANGDPVNKSAVIFKFEKGTTAFVKMVTPR